MTNAAMKDLVRDMIHMNSTQISFVVYRATKTSEFCHSGLIVLSTAVFLHPHGNYSSPYPNHYKLTLI